MSIDQRVRRLIKLIHGPQRVRHRRAGATWRRQVEKIRPI
jgi:hypothetical protein